MTPPYPPFAGFPPEATALLANIVAHIDAEWMQWVYRMTLHAADR